LLRFTRETGVFKTNNVNSKNNNKNQEDALDAAAGWIARLRSDTVSEQDQQGFALWLAASPEHSRAMDSMLDLWDDLAVSRHLRPGSADVIALQSPQRRRWLGAGLAAAACALFALVLTPYTNLDEETLRYQTRKGEQLQIDLADGSRISLNTSSSLTVRVSAKLRHVTLHRGEAFFQVKKDEKLPFVVDIGAAEVRVMGTAFNIHRRESRSDITVTEGVVRVTELGSPGNRQPATELLYPNQSVAASQTGLARPELTDSTATAAWREGKIVADGMPLAMLIEEIARYHDVKILITEPGLAQKTVSGVFQLDKPDVILQALEHSFGIHSMELEDASVLLISNPR
jgi:transmembrane sensor